jgi:tetratricopeptide (TPR) repeat protein
MGNSEALSCFKKASSLAEKHYTPENTADYLNSVIHLACNRGRVYRDILKNPRKALECYLFADKWIQENLDLSDEQNQTHHLRPAVKYALGNIYLQDSPEKALAHYEEAERLLSAIDPERKIPHMAFIIYDKGKAYLKMGNLKLAEEAFQEYLEINRFLHKDKKAHPDLGTGYRGLGNLMRYRAKKAEEQSNNYGALHYYRISRQRYYDALLQYKATLAPGHFDIMATESLLRETERRIKRPQETLNTKKLWTPSHSSQFKKTILDILSSDSSSPDSSVKKVTQKPPF